LVSGTRTNAISFLLQVPWGIANGLLGGGARDLILFWGIAAYAVCGCYAQVRREERYKEKSDIKRRALKAKSDIKRRAI